MGQHNKVNKYPAPARFNHFFIPTLTQPNNFKYQSAFKMPATARDCLLSGREVYETMLSVVLKDIREHASSNAEYVAQIKQLNSQLHRIGLELNDIKNDVHATSAAEALAFNQRDEAFGQRYALCSRASFE